MIEGYEGGFLPDFDVAPVIHARWVDSCTDKRRWEQGMTDCTKCVYAIMDYEEYYGTKLKEWFVTGCEKCRVVEQSDCPEFEEREDSMADRFGYGEIDLDIHPCKGCEDYEPPDGCKTRGGCGNPVTNADRIRSMTDEELADFLWGIGNNPATGTTYVSGKPIFTNQDGYKGWLDWLKNEVEDDSAFGGGMM